MMKRYKLYGTYEARKKLKLSSEERSVQAVTLRKQLFEHYSEEVYY